MHRLLIPTITSLSQVPTLVMAWRCSGSTNIELISNLKNAAIIKSNAVATAMKRVDRANYVLYKGDAYMDSPQSIGYSATISAPHMHAHACESLLPYIQIPGSKVLDVGSGSGYLTSIFWRLIQDTPPSGSIFQGKVVGIEHIPELVEWSKKNIEKDGLQEELENGAIEMIAGDGREGYAAAGPYNAIHVGAAAPVLPQALVDQLASPGRLFIPVGEDGGNQYIYHIDKDETGKITKTQIMGVRYVPLTDRPGL